MYTIRKILFFLLSLYSIELSALERNIRFINISNRDGLPNNTVNAICQDRRGFIWLGTDNGLCKYDGKNFKVFDTIDETWEISPSKRILEILEDREGGYLWILTTRGVRRFNTELEKFERLDNDSMVISSHAICQTSDGKIYIGAGDKMWQFKPQTDRIDPVLIYDRDIRGRITAMEETSDGYLWMGTKTDGLIKVNMEMNSIDRYRENDTMDKWLVSSRISSLYFDDASKVLWIGTEDQGVCCYDIRKKSFYLPEGIPGISVSAFCKDADGNMWIGSDTGVYIYDNNLRRVIAHLSKSHTDRTGLSDNFISVIMRDREDNILVGTTYGGIDVFSRTFRHFRYLEWGDGPDKLSGRTVRKIIPYSEDKLLIATEDGNLDLWDKNSMKIQSITLPSGESMNPYTLMIDSKDRLYIGSKFNGIYLYDMKTSGFKQFNTDKYPGLSVNNILALVEDNDGTIWVGTASGLAVYNEENDLFIPFDPTRFRKQSINFLMKDSAGDIWIATSDKGLFRYSSRRKARIQSYREFADANTSYVDDWVNYVYQDSRGYIWFSTNNTGLHCLDMKTRKLTNYTTNEFLPSNTIYSIIEDLSGDIWVSSDNGLSCFNVDEGYFTNYSESEGLPNRQFTNNSVYRDEDGLLYFGTINGLLSFHPDSLAVSSNVPQVEFTEFSAMGKRVMPVKDSTNRQSSVNENTIVLNHTQAKSFSLKYTVPTISHASSVFFSTKFARDGEWTYHGSDNYMSVTNLRPGEHILQVRASFNNRWTGEEPVNSVRLIIKPPFYASAIALLTYLCSLISIIITVYVLVRRNHREKARKVLEQLEKDKQDELHRMRMNFFTNISHQIRIPLSLILAPMESMINKDDGKNEDSHKMNLIYRNVVKMKMLIDELLQFSKIKSSSEKIKLRCSDAQKYIKDIADGFHLIAEEKNIRFEIDVESTGQEVWFSDKIIEKILFNLLSNAFKFTEKGTVSLISKIERQNELDTLFIEVRDTGIGIDKSELERIFDGYYQVEDNLNSGYKGFGIGLALTKELVKLHKGSISVDSKPGEGSCFRLSLGVDRSMFSADQLITDSVQNMNVPDYTFLLEDDVQFPSETESDTSAETDKSRILIIEDDAELLAYYGELFGEKYAVSLFRQGQDALKAIPEFNPDVIISDVMMPGINGFELTHHIKSDFRTSHIPIILLTAKTGLHNQLDGLESGADLYVEKPFHPSFLLGNVRNMIEGRKRMMAKYTMGEAKVDDLVSNERDKRFLNTVNESILNNLSNENYSIKDLTEAAAVSRTLLHMKLKALAGMSATEYINSVRIQESIKLLMQGYRVSEAAFACGFSSPNYYSRCFRKYVGKAPAEYILEMKNKEDNNKGQDL